jgi:hypothetical protein
MEIAGLVIGAVAAIIPAYQGIDKISSMVSDIKHFSAQHNMLWLQICTQKMKLRNEYILLFGDKFDTGEVKVMLGDQSHPKWSDSEFQRKFWENLGQSFEHSPGPFQIINTTLEALEMEIQKLMPTTRAVKVSRISAFPTCILTVLQTTVGGAVANPLPSKTPYNATVAEAKALAKGVEASVIRTAKGAVWSIKKTKLEPLLVTLRAQINDLIHLREQRTVLKGFKTPTQTIKSIKNGCLLSAIRDARAASNRLYQAVTAVTDCHCHCIDLQLSTSVATQDSATSERLYRMLITPLSNAAPFTCVVVRPEKATSTITINQKTKAKLPAGQCNPQGGMKRGTNSQTCIPKPKSRVRFDLGIGLGLLKPVSGDNLESGDAKGSELSQQQIMTGIVVSLCPAAGLCVDSASTYLGLLPDVDSYRHVLHRAERPRSASRMSLSEIIKLANTTSTKKSFAWPVVYRYQLAYILAFSMLCCSGSWFKANWRSEDIILVQQQQLGEEWIKSPHITTVSRNSQLESGTSLAPSPQLFSLAVTLIEIGYGDSLCNLYTEVEKAKYGGLRMQWDYLKEFCGAKRLSTMLSAEMGPRYAKVVQRCLECNFGIDEKNLDELAMQEVFYEKVICELEACVKFFT